jgi:hypothetical protein
MTPTTDFLSTRPPLPKPIAPPPLDVRMRKWMDEHTGIIETPENSNRHPIIDEWNRMAGVPVGSFWCGSAAGACLKAFDIEPPKSYAWSPTWDKWGKPAPDVVPTGAAFTIHSKKLGRTHHVGLIYLDLGVSIESWEGNASNGASNNGDRTRKRMRMKSSLKNVRVCGEC